MGYLLNKQIQDLIETLATKIRDPQDAVRLVPLIKDYLDVSVKNDDSLIKMAAIVQRAMNANSEMGGDSFLSQKEIDDLRELANNKNEI
jgi:hypothetical protein